MWPDVIAAARAGLLLGVKWAVVVLLVSLTLGALAQDYLVVRQQARHGQQAFQYLQQQQASRKTP